MRLTSISIAGNIFSISPQNNTDTWESNFKILDLITLISSNLMVTDDKKIGSTASLEEYTFGA